MTIHNDPYYWGAYLNMARHNVFMILNDIAAKLGNPQFEHGDEGLVHKNGNLCHPVFKILCGTDRIQQSNLIELLYYHFPFLKVLGHQLKVANPDPSYYHQIFKDWFYNLHHLRNFYLHAHHKSVTPKENVFKDLGKIFDDALDVAIDRFDLKDKSGLQIYRRWIGRKEDNPLFQFRFTDNNDQLTEKGLAFFICQFLEKEYVHKFLKNLQGFDARTAREIYAIYSCRLPQHKLVSDNNADALLLDMLNELQRCPKELYYRLHENDKQKFITREGNEEEETPDSVLVRSQDRFPYFALRYIEHNNVLPSLLAHIDIGKYVFHTYKKTGPDGERYLRRWDKNIHVFGRLAEIDQEYPEILQKLKTDPATITEDTPAPYLIATNPHYHFVNKNIAFKVKSDDKLLAPFKTRKISDSDVEIEMPVNSQADIVICNDELCGLLFYDYLAKKYNTNYTAEGLILGHKENIERFLQDVATGKIKPVETVNIVNQYQPKRLTDAGLSKNKFKSQFKDRKTKLAEILNEYSLKPHMIPDKLVRYLMGIEQASPQDKANAILLGLIDKNDILLDETSNTGRERNRKKEKINNRKAHLRAGENATFLAKDMLYFQPHYDPEGKDAPNPDEYRKLQAALAFFSRDKEHIGRVFQTCGLIYSQNPHPFLSKINIDKCRTNIDFYRCYLAQRSKYLSECIEHNRNDTQYYKSIHFLDLKPNQDDISIQAYARSITAMPTNLPRGLFKDATLDLIRQYGPEDFKEAIPDDGRRYNIVYLLQKYLELRGDKNQGYYSYKRNYRVVDEFFDTRNRSSTKEMLNPITLRYKTIEDLTDLAAILHKDKNGEKTHIRTDGATHYYDVYRKQVIENEKLIRHFRACDIMLFLMCEKLVAKCSYDSNLSKVFEGKPHLESIMPGNEKSILNKSIEYKLPLAGKMIFDTIKIKDYGKFRRFLKDRRLESLLSYYQGSNIKRDKLKEQLDAYERLRIRLFKVTYDFEIACKNNAELRTLINQLVNGEHGHANHRALLEKLVEIQVFQWLSKPMADNLNEIRRKFAHNKFPLESNMKGVVIPDGNVMKDIKEYALGKYEMMTTELNE